MMKMVARDIMVQEYEFVRPDDSVRAAVRVLFEAKVRETGYKPFGTLVLDELGRMVGMVSMFDILYHLRPPYMNLPSMDRFKPSEDEMEDYLERFEDLRVEQIMHTPVLSVSPDDPFIVLVDLMVKDRIRRVPVVEERKVLGMVYLSDVFYRFCSKWLEREKGT